MRAGAAVIAPRSARRWARAAALACAAWSALGAARAGDVAPPVPTREAQPSPSPYLLAVNRYSEINVDSTLQIDWNKDTGSSGPATRAGVVLGAEAGWPLDQQRVRPSLFGGAKLGAWGDDGRGPFAFVFGPRFRWTPRPLMWDVFDVYAVVHADFVVPVNGDAVFRPGAGLGVRVARLFALEATWDVSAPMGPKFSGTEHPDLAPLGLSLGAMFDACFGCKREAAPQVARDLACRLYEQAKPTSDASQRAICGAVPEAIMACPDPKSASRSEDGMVTFLEALGKRADGPAKDDVARLVATHHALSARWAEYDARALASAQKGERLAERWSYAPTPIELRAYLGCDVDAAGRPVPPPRCDEVTNP